MATYPNFLPPTLNFFLQFGQTVHLKNEVEGKAMHFKGFFFFDINPTAHRKTKIVYNFGLSACSRVKRKTIVLSKDIKVIFLQYFLISLTVKSRYVYSIPSHNLGRSSGHHR